MTKEELLRVIEQAATEKSTRLDLSDQRLAELPPEIGQLSELEFLDLSNNRLTSLPPEIGQLINLNNLSISDTQLTSIPPEIGQLINLERLFISDNPIATLPPEIGRLVNLKSLSLPRNQLTELPLEINQLINLNLLGLGGNRFTDYPPGIGQLVNLEHLFLWGIPARALPLELGRLTNLLELSLGDNPLTSPPPEIIEQGTEAILAYLRERLEESSKQWVSKLLVVGEGGVGKSSLLRALRGEKFEVQQSTTHGIEVRSLDVAHPGEADVVMQLNTWDFGGQEIYHATHQFFLTNRSLFLLAWNARLGFEQGKLYYWLDTIQALAPDSPILLVATWTDERDADIPLSELQRKYPQIIGQCDISNRSGAGIEALRQKIAEAAANLPLMGELWPTTWLNAASTIRTRPEKHITPQQMNELMAEHGVKDTSAVVLARWLHELGDILYFPESEDLRGTVILKPQWVTEYISKVLESEEVIERFGIFTRAHMETLWSDLDSMMREHFLWLMERFDLSYKTPDNREISLVVERLPLEPPDYTPLWDAHKENGESNEVSMKFKLNTVPAGIPTWFIARTHRFTTHNHWRTGALFAYEPEQPNHLGLVQSFFHEGYVRLTVRGPNPQNFFALLKDGIEVTLARFPGLQITRSIPCPGHDDEPCTHEFNHAHLEKALERKPPVLDIQCPVAFENVSVPGLLFGLHWRTQDAVLTAISDLRVAEEEQHEEVLSKLDNLTALVQREFTNAFRREQAKIESHCPNIFVLRPREAAGWPQLLQQVKNNLIGQTIGLQLFCQAPGHWHPTVAGGFYEITQPAEWLRATAPYLRRLITVLKYTSPLIGPWLGVAIPDDYEKHLKNDIELMGELVKKLPELKEDAASALAENIGEIAQAEHIEGAGLRALRLLLDEKDPQQRWGGLKKILTPEGHYLWLCDHHAAEYYV